MSVVRSTPTVPTAIAEVCNEIANFLIEKNQAYGNSALEPCRIFSKVGPLEQINVRIDDKLNRMIQGNGYPGDDDELDLIGYLILKRVAKKMHIGDSDEDNQTKC